jgi:putative CocE/NonD family hydrolase
MFAVSDIYSEQLFPGGMLSRIWSRDYDELMLALDQNDREKTQKFPYFNDPRLSGPQPVDGDEDEALLRAALAEHRDNFRLHDMMPELAFRGEGPMHDPGLGTETCSPYHYLLAGAKPGLPIYSVSGWYDGGGYANGAITRFLTMCGPHDRLLLGPWDHGARTNVSPWRAQPAPEFPLLAEVLRFFDEHLLGLHTGLEAEAPVHYFSLHADQWKSALTWPPIPSTERLYFAPNHVATPSAPTHVSTVTYQVRFDTTTGTRTRWERLGAVNIEDYYFDWNGRDEGMLNFTSDAFPVDTELSGHAIMNLCVASSQRDAAIFVYLAEIDATGQVRYITEGMLRALHRAVAEAPADYRTTWPWRSFTRAASRLLTPDIAERLVFALLPVSWTLKRGSRLRISIAGADADHFPQVPHGRPPRLKLTLGGADASFVDLPLQHG